MKDILRVEGPRKLRGESKFVDDLQFPNMLYGATVRSPVARGLLKKINFTGDIPWNEFVIVTAKDIPGKNYISIIEPDWPFLVHERINHCYEPVVLLAHQDRELVKLACQYVKLEIEPLAAVLSIEESLAPKEVIWGADNLLKSYLINKGDVDQVWAQADYVIEGEYFTGAQEQLYIENNGMIANYDPEAGLTIWGSMQCPYYVHGAIMPLFGFPAEKVRIIQTETGGAFGGKEDYPSMIAGHAALLAYKACRPVKIVYNRSEDLAATTKRHPSRTRHKTALSKDGKLLAMEIDFVIDGGAYATLSSVVLSRGALHASGPYNCPNVRIRARAVATNTPPHGAFRGFGAPQSIFAMERHLDRVAHQIGISPEFLRRRNFIKNGEMLACGQQLKERVDFDKLLDIALGKSNYHQKLARFQEENKTSSIKKGIGFACFMHGAGFTGSGEKYIASVAGIRATSEGKLEVLASSTEMGQGRNTVFTQIVAESLGIELADVIANNPDTSDVPNSGPTVASRTSMIVGKLVQEAAIGIRQILINSGLLAKEYSRDQFIEAVKKYNQTYGLLKSFNQYKHPQHINWDDQKYVGDAYPTYAWAVYLAEVSVDTLTYQTKVDNFVAVQEVGRVLNKTLAEGQIEGGVVQGIGYAIYEKVLYQDGKILNNQMTNYIIPTALDINELIIHFEEWNKEYGPGGAKGIGGVATGWFCAGGNQCH